MKKFLLLFAVLFALSTWTNAIETNPVQFKRQDSDHIKQIFEAWDKEKGDYLYESMATLVMHQQQPERPEGMNKTPFELLQTMGEERIDRLDRIATDELENEKNATRGKRESYYWENWRAYLRDTKCGMTQGSSGGDPHNTTFDGEKYDFQNAGDYLLTSSDDNTFMVQVQQYRHDESISLIGGTTMNVNGDILEFKSVESDEKARQRKMITVNGEEVQTEGTNLILPQGGVVDYKNKKYVVKWPTGEQMQVSTRKFQGNELYDLYVSVPKCRQDYYGLLGNNDGERNDFIIDKPDVNKDLSHDRSTYSHDELFGEGRKSPEVQDRTKRSARYIAHDFGDTHQLDEKTSLFSNQMTDIPDFVRYPSKPMSLDGLTDEQIEEGLRKAREAGVAEDDLYGAVYDYGYVGLDPVAYKDEYEKPKRTEKYKEPELEKEEENQKANQQPVRIRPTVFLGTGVYYPSRPRNPRTSSPPPPPRPSSGPMRSSPGTSRPGSGPMGSNPGTTRPSPAASKSSSGTSRPSPTVSRPSSGTSRTSPAVSRPSPGTVRPSSTVSSPSTRTPRPPSTKGGR